MSSAATPSPPPFKRGDRVKIGGGAPWAGHSGEIVGRGARGQDPDPNGWYSVWMVKLDALGGQGVAHYAKELTLAADDEDVNATTVAGLWDIVRSTRASLPNLTTEIARSATRAAHDRAVAELIQRGEITEETPAGWTP